MIKIYGVIEYNKIKQGLKTQVKDFTEARKYLKPMIEKKNLRWVILFDNDDKKTIYHGYRKEKKFVWETILREKNF